MKVYLYQSAGGRPLVEDEIDAVKNKEADIVYRRIAGVKEYGFDYWRVQFKPIKGKLWEIKFRYRLQHRLLYVMQEADSMVILRYVTKKTQKLLKVDIDVAMKRMKEVLKNEKE